MVVTVFLIFFMLSTSGVFAATPEEIDLAIFNAGQWLSVSLDGDYSWQYEVASGIRDAALISSYLEEKQLVSEVVYGMHDWLQTCEPANYDFAARLLPFLTEEQDHGTVLQNLLDAQHSDGGWGLTSNYGSDLMDTVVVMNALLDEETVDPGVIGQAAGYIVDRQNADGSWSFIAGQPGSVYLTAETILLLNRYAVKCSPDSPEIITSLREGGEYLVSQMGSDQTWGTDENNLVNTIQAYRAVLDTVGLEPVSTVEDALIALQGAQGGWNSDYYTTALAATALTERQNLSEASISGITLYKCIGEDEIETYNFVAYENVIIQVAAQYDQEAALMQLLVKQPDGTVVPAEEEDFFYWNTTNSPPGSYSVIALVKDRDSGKIIASREQGFTIEPDFTLSEVTIETFPGTCRVDHPVNVEVNVGLINHSNQDGEAALEVAVLASDGSIVASANPVVLCSLDEHIITTIPLSFQPDVTAEQTYTITAHVSYGDSEVLETQGSFEVLPPPPPTRIDAVQNLGRTYLCPGTDSAMVTFTLSGIGEPGAPQRDPIDLVMVIDNSGSMAWANQNYDTSRPNRWDHAKEACKLIIGLLQDQDRGGLVVFAASATVKQHITADKELLETRIDQIPFPGGGTGIGWALQKSINLLDAESTPERDKIMFLISDGCESYLSDSSVVNQARIANKKGMKIYTIGLGNGADEDLLQEIAEATGALYAFSPTMEELDKIVREILGGILDTAGENVVFTTTIPAGPITVDTAAISPEPTSVTVNDDGSTTISWEYDRILMGEEINIPLALTGNNLLSDTIVLLTTGTVLTYTDLNQDQVVVPLDDLSLPVNKYKIDTNIVVDKTGYLPGEDISIYVQAENFSPSECTLSGIIDIVDVNGVVVDTVYQENSITWSPGQIQNLQYSWNCDDTMAGDYQVRARWYEGEQLIDTGATPFAILAGGEIANSVATDKVSYNCNETVAIIEKVFNNSSNALASDLNLQTQIKDSAANILWSIDTPLNEMPPDSELQVLHNWDAAQNQPGDYTVTSSVYRSEEFVCSQQTVFTILPSSGESTGIDGDIELLTRNIYPQDNLALNYSVQNTGNSPLENVQLLLRFVDLEQGEYQNILDTIVSLAAGESLTDTFNWSHQALPTGSYMLVLSAVLENGQEVPLSSGGFTVLKPLQLTVQQVVRPRILAWAESTDNINLVESTLDDKELYYTLVNDRYAFMDEFNTGKYNTYLMMDTGNPLVDHEDETVAAAVYSSQGLIATRDAYGDNFKNLAMFGLKFIDNNPKQGYTINCLPGLTFAGYPDLSGSGKTQRVALGTGVEQAVLLNMDEDCPAVTLNHYGAGEAMLFTFDLGSALPTEDAAAMLWHAVETVAPTVDSSGTVVEVEIPIQELGEVNARVEALAPQGSVVLWTCPPSDTLTWKFTSQPGQARTLRIVLDIPEGTNNPCITINAAYLINEEYWIFDSVETRLMLL